MSGLLFRKGKKAYSDKQIDFLNDTIKSRLLDLATAGTWNKLITSVTGAASPITLTSNAHGFSNGDLLVVGNVGGNLAANQLCKAANVATNTFDIQTYTRSTALAMTGSAAYTSGGYVINLTQAAFLSDLASAVGTDVALSGKADTDGVHTSSAWTHTAVPSQANSVRAFILYRDTGTAGTSNLLYIGDGKMQVIAAATALISATTIVVEPLPGAIPNGTALVFSNGVTATLTALAAFGDTTLTVSALAAQVTARHTADVTTTSAGLPVTPNGGDIVFTPAVAASNGIFIL